MRAVQAIAIGTTVVLVSGMAPARAARDWLTFSASAEIFGSRFFIDRESTLNPDNALAGLQDADLSAALRADASVSWRDLEVSLGPRARATRNFGDEASTEEKLYLQDWFVGYRLADWQVSYSRELDFWGPSLFSSPSNPFYGSIDESNPFIELGAREFVRLDGPLNERTTLSLIANVGAGRDEGAPTPFERSYAIKADYTATSFFGGGIFTRAGDSSHLGAFAQVTATDALLLYADIGASERSTAYRVAPGAENAAAAGPTSPVFTRRGDERGPYTDTLLGASYTTEGGSTLSVEYRHDSEGLSRRELDDYFDVVGDLAALLDREPERAGEGLSSASRVGVSTLGRNYVQAAYFKRDVVQDLSVDVRVSVNLDSSSAQLIGVANYYFNDNLGFASNLIWNVGDRARNEYRRYIDGVLFVGLKYYF